MKELSDFIKGMLSKDGAQSFARSGCMFVIYFKVVESLYIVSKTGIIPDIPTNWWLLISGLYALSKGLDVLNEKVQGAANGQPANPAAGQ